MFLFFVTDYAVRLNLGNLAGFIYHLGLIVKGDVNLVTTIYPTLERVSFVPVDVRNIELSIQAAQDIATIEMVLSLPVEQQLRMPKEEIYQLWLLTLSTLSKFKVLTNGHMLALGMGYYYGMRVEIITQPKAWLDPGDSSDIDELLTKCPNIPLGHSPFDATRFCCSYPKRLENVVLSVKSQQWSAFLQGTHHRLGRGSPIGLLYEDVLSLIVEHLVQ